jgi:beta-N-acetylhexosaminidase
MVGQLIMTGFAGREPEDPDVARAARDVSEGRISGVIVRDSNVENFLQLRQLISALTTYGGKMPALIAIDQPGGPDTVLSEEKGFAFFNSANSVSSAHNPYDAQVLYRAMAGELASLGVTLNIGPSEDVCGEDGVNLSALCFGTAPSRIASFARAFNFGHHDRGVLTALRHAPFRPGLQTSLVNEQPSSAILHLIMKGETSDALVIPVKAREPLPVADISFGLPHRKPRARHDPGAGFHGVLIFEIDMGPGGAPVRHEEAVLRAFQAGADMILIREPEALPAEFPAICLGAVQSGLQSGRLQMGRIEDAYRHVQLLKEKLRTVQPRTKVAGLDH